MRYEQGLKPPKEDSVGIIVKITKEEHKRLKTLCMELDISMQVFIRRLLVGSLPTVDTNRGKNI